MQNLYAIFLRAVNVSGKNLIKMTELRDILVKNGFEQVKTYIQSGNLIVSTDLPKEQVQVQIQQLIKDHFKLSIEVFVWGERQLSSALANNPFDGTLPGNRVFLGLLDNEPTQDRITALRTIDLGQEQFYIEDNIFYFYLPEGMAKSKLSNSFIENKLQVKSTNRNRNTIERIFELLKSF